MEETKNRLEIFFEWLQTHKFFALFIFVLVLFALWTFESFATQNVENFETYEVSTQNLNTVVSLSGIVKPVDEAELSFEKSGVVNSVEVKVGDMVKVGQVIATLSGGDDSAKVSEARANLNTAKYALEEARSGSKQETIDIKQNAISKTKNDIEQNFTNISDTLKNISINGNIFVKDGVKDFFSGNLSDGYRMTVNSCDSIKENIIAVQKIESEKALATIEGIVSSFNNLSNPEKRDKVSEIQNIHMPIITNFLTELKNLFSGNCLVTNPNYDTARVNIANYRTVWSSLNADLKSKLTALANSEIALIQAESDLQLSSTGEKIQKIRQLESAFSAVNARLEAATVQSNKNKIISPFDGVITNIDIKKGELVSPGVQTISLISDAQFQIESKVSEIDVAKLFIGAKATVDFDSYGKNEKFEAEITNISQAGIITEGVPTYKTIFNFLQKSEKIRSGMTSNLEVVTGSKENVLSIPAKFIETKDGIKTVNLLTSPTSSRLEKREIKTGVFGANGNIEIVQGLNKGDIIVVNK